MVHIVGSISGPHHFSYKNCGFRGFLSSKFWRGVQRVSGVLVQKAFQKKGW